MNAPFSPTGYWAHFTVRYSKPDPTNLISGRAWGNRWTDTLPVVGISENAALVIDADGTVKTVHALADELREGGDIPNEEGETFSVSLEVNAYDGSEARK